MPRTRRPLTALLAAAALVTLLIQGSGEGSAALVTINGRIAASLGGDGSRIFTNLPDGSSVLPTTGAANVTDTEPEWSPDGTRIAFVRENFGNGLSDIFVADVSLENGTVQSSPVPLTAPTGGAEDRLQRSPAWSPDGTKIAYAGATNAEASVTEIFIMASSGLGQQKKTSLDDYLSGLDWSPDGSRIVFARQDGPGPNSELAIYNVATGLVTNLKSASDPDRPTDLQDYDRSPTWSPDGSRIAYTHVRGGVNRIALVSATGQSLGVVAGGPDTGGPATVGWAEWSPDGSRIAYIVGGKELWTIAPDGSGVTPRVWTDPKELAEPSWQSRQGYPTPAISRVTPASLTAGGAATVLTVTGSGFVPESVVRWRGDARGYRLINAGTLEVDLTAADLATSGIRELTVTNPAPGGGTARLAFTVVPQQTVVTVGAGSVPRPLDASLKLQARVKNGKTTFQRLRLDGPRGAKVAISCRPGCGKKVKIRTIPRSGVLDLKPIVGTTAIPVGWKIELRITKAGAIGRYITYRLTKKKGFDGRICRIPVGTTKLRSCKAL